MIRFLIRNTKTGEYLYRASTVSGKDNRWVKGADNATLITTKSAATTIAGNLITKMTGKKTRIYSWREPGFYPVEIIKVGVILIPDGTQPFLK